MNKQLLEDAINGLEQLKPLLQRMLIRTNYEGLGREDAQELGEHFDIALECMQKQLTGGWIPVSDRLPEKKETVIVTVIDFDGGTEFVAQDCFFNGCWGKYNNGWLEVIAWMPLPEPYREEVAQ